MLPKAGDIISMGDSSARYLVIEQPTIKIVNLNTGVYDTKLYQNRFAITSIEDLDNIKVCGKITDNVSSN